MGRRCATRPSATQWQVIPNLSAYPVATLDGHEQTSAKSWELLRQNDRFKKAVARVEELDQRPRPKTPQRLIAWVGMS